jgi:hypothetical protein
MLAMRSKVRIFQPYLAAEQLAIVDKEFVPFNNVDNPRAELREYFLFKKIFDDIDSIDADYIGLFSYKFGEKAMLSGVDVIDFIHSNSGHDVYLFNPYPFESYTFYNIWEQAEYYHPGILDLTEEALQRAGHQIDLNSMGRTYQITLFCNFWVANKSFWKGYFDFLQPVVEFMLADSRYFNLTRYWHGEAAYFPFIVERLFTTYLAFLAEPRICSYQYPEAHFEKLALYELQGKAYKMLVPYIKKQDQLYGEAWPKVVRDELVERRNVVMHELSLSDYSRVLRA